MTEPIDYQTPLPEGLNLRWQELPDGVRVSRDAVGRLALWREAVLPPACIALLLASGVAVLRWLREQARVQPAWIVAEALVGVAMSLLLAYVVRDAWQNAGVVTEIAVSGGTLYWRKQTLWGTSERFWPLSDVRDVTVDTANFVLKVHRRRGAPLGAFAFHRTGELQAVADQLNRAIRAQRNQPSSPQVGPLPTGGSSPARPERAE